jgi:hypothetical protein
MPIPLIQIILISPCWRLVFDAAQLLRTKLLLKVKQAVEDDIRAVPTTASPKVVF